MRFEGFVYRIIYQQDTYYIFEMLTTSVFGAIKVEGFFYELYEGLKIFVNGDIKVRENDKVLSINGTKNSCGILPIKIEEYDYFFNSKFFEKKDILKINRDDFFKHSSEIVKINNDILVNYYQKMVKAKLIFWSIDKQINFFYVNKMFNDFGIYSYDLLMLYPNILSRYCNTPMKKLNGKKFSIFQFENFIFNYFANTNGDTYVSFPKISKAFYKETGIAPEVVLETYLNFKSIKLNEKIIGKNIIIFDENLEEISFKETYDIFDFYVSELSTFTFEKKIYEITQKESLTIIQNPKNDKYQEHLSIENVWLTLNNDKRLEGNFYNGMSFLPGDIYDFLFKNIKNKKISGKIEEIDHHNNEMAKQVIQGKIEENKGFFGFNMLGNNFYQRVQEIIMTLIYKKHYSFYDFCFFSINNKGEYTNDEINSFVQELYNPNEIIYNMNGYKYKVYDKCIVTLAFETTVINKTSIDKGDFVTILGIDEIESKFGVENFVVFKKNGQKKKLYVDINTFIKCVKLGYALPFNLLKVKKHKVIVMIAPQKEFYINKYYLYNIINNCTHNFILFTKDSNFIEKAISDYVKVSKNTILQYKYRDT